MKLPILAGNWKMNGSTESVKALLSKLAQSAIEPSIKMVVFPPFPFLPQTEQILRETSIGWGAQDMCAEDDGAFTGEVSATMLLDFGCQFVIVGHSERRHIYGESDELVARKCEKALRCGLTPILCVGETQAERQQGLTEAVVARQLYSALDRIGVADFDKIVVAYEPVWAIGTGLTASPDEAEAVHAFLKHKISEKDAIVGKKMQVLYGGSLKAANANELFAMPNIDGGLVGGASLNGDEFLQMASLLASSKD